jgi:pimeloyl-ACP methyl ester carboxylesterase
MPSTEWNLPGKLLLVPGIGATPDIFEPQREAFGDALIAPDWLDPKPGETVAEYASRWADVLRPEVTQAITRDDGWGGPADDAPLLIGGLSFGGMVATELARHLPARAVVLIASELRGDAVPDRFYAIRPLAHRLPDAVLRRLAPWIALAYAKNDGLDDPRTALLRQMSRQANLPVLRWGTAAMQNWSLGNPGPDYPPVHRIHGADDWLIPRQGHIDRLVPRGKHLINLSHPQTVNTWLQDIARQYADHATAASQAA